MSLCKTHEISHQIHIRKNRLRLRIASAALTACAYRKFFYDSAAAKAYSVTPVFSEGYFGTLRSEGFEYYKDRKVIIFTGKSKIVIRQEEFEEEEK